MIYFIYLFNFHQVCTPVNIDVLQVAAQAQTSRSAHLLNFDPDRGVHSRSRAERNMMYKLKIFQQGSLSARDIKSTLGQIDPRNILTASYKVKICIFRLKNSGIYLNYPKTRFNHYKYQNYFCFI